MRARITAYLPALMVYAGVGGASALVEWASFLSAMAVLDVHYTAASAFAFVVSTGVNCLLSSRVAFHSRGRSARAEAALVYLVSLGGLGINLLAMILLVEIAGIGLLAGKIAGTGVAFGWNFLARQFLVFSRTPRWGGARAETRPAAGREAEADPALP